MWLFMNRERVAHCLSTIPFRIITNAVIDRKGTVTKASAQLLLL